VKCKSSTSISKPKFPEKSDIRISDRIPEAFAGHVQPAAQTCSSLSLSSA
jgi:hypothetical protein